MIGPAGRWISVYDEAPESQDESTLREVAEHLSATLEHAVITVLVHDSDVLRLSLFEPGGLRAEYDSNPEFSGGQKPKTFPVTDWE